MPIFLVATGEASACSSVHYKGDGAKKSKQGRKSEAVRK